MLKACIARIVYQYPSVESFPREPQRNPSLILACGFKLMACRNDRQRYRVPFKSAYSKFNRQRYSRQGWDLGYASRLGQARVSLHRSQRRPQKKVKRWFGYSVNGIFAQRGKDHCRRRGCRFPLSRSAVRTKVQPPFNPRCDGSDIRHVKAECGIDCGCSVPAHEPDNFAKREASSLFADVERCKCAIYSILCMINSTFSVHICIE